MSLALVLLLAGAPPVSTLSIGADVGSAAAAAAVSRAVSVSVSFGLPITSGFALELEPSLYWSSAGALSVVQGTLEMKPRFYLRRIIAELDEVRIQDGPFLAGGVALAFAREDSWKVVTSAFAAGPVAEIGWRLGWGRAFVEPYAGWMALLGVRDARFSSTHGPIGGLTMGLSL